MLLFAFALSLSPVAASGAAANALNSAQAAFDAAQFEKAVPLFRAVLYPPQVLGAEARKARLELAESLFFTNQHEAARSELQLLLRQAPNIKIDTNNASPDFVDFFNLVHDQQEKKAAPRHHEPEHRAPEPEHREPEHVAPADTHPIEEAHPVVPAETKSDSPGTSNPPPMVEQKHYVAAPWYLKILPFGIGQFANHDPIGGTAFLSVEIVLLGGNIGISVYNAGQISDHAYPRTGAYPALYWAQVVTAAAAYATAIFGIIDAFVWSPARGAKHEGFALAPGVTDRGLALMMMGSF